MSKINITVNKKEFKKIQEAALFNKLDVHNYRTMVVVIGNEDSIKDTKEHYRLVYDKKNIEVIKKDFISKPEKMRFSRGKTIDRVLIQTTLGIDEYTNLMKYIGSSLSFYHLNK